MTLVSVALPAYNESNIIAESARTIVDCLKTWYGDNEWELIIVDNGSTDSTFDIALSLSRILPNVVPLRIDQKGVGAALKAAWGIAKGNVIAYTDADLPFRLENLRDVINNTVGTTDITIGSRHMRGGYYKTSALRFLLSHAYILWLNLLFDCRISDNCGIRSLKKEAYVRMLPFLKSDGWFFGTEVIVAARRLRLVLEEVPVHCHNNDARPSSVNILAIILSHVKLTLLLRLRATH